MLVTMMGSSTGAASDAGAARGPARGAMAHSVDSRPKAAQRKAGRLLRAGRGRMPRGCRCRALCGCHAPYRVRQVVGNDQRAARIYRYAYRAAACGAVAIAKARDEVDGRAGRPPILERYEHDLVAHGFAAIPTAMFADENALGELAAHGRAGKSHAQRGHVRAQRIVRLDRRGDFIGILRADAVVHMLAPIAVRPAVEG